MRDSIKTPNAIMIIRLIETSPYSSIRNDRVRKITNPSSHLATFINIPPYMY